MNLNLFDSLDGAVLRERENNLRPPMHQTSNRPVQGGDNSRFPAHTPLAMAYVPFQQWGDTMQPEEALNCGTLFNDLIFPFEEGGGR